MEAAEVNRDPAPAPGRRIAIAALCLLGAGLLVALCSYLITLSFLSGVVIENRSGERLLVACVGAGESGRRVLLPPYRFRGPLPARESGSGEVAIQPEQRRRLLLHTEAGDLGWILARGEQGKFKMAAIARNNRTGGCCFSPERGAYVIPLLDTLPDAPAEMLIEVGLTVR